jgi:hypothetical protein
MPDWFWKLTWGDWCAALQGAALTFAVLVACYQLWALRHDQRGWETLKACEKYDTDPVLDNALQKLREWRSAQEGPKDPKKYTLEARTLSNYFEGIALGVAQGFYDERVVRDHLQDIMEDHVEEFFTPPVIKDMGFSRGEISRLRVMLGSWERAETYYSFWRR